MSALGRWRERTHWKKFSLCSGSGKSAFELSLDDAFLQPGPDEDLPAAAVPAERHHALGAIDLDPRRTLQPIRELVGRLADQRRDFQHVGCFERQLEGHDHVIEIVDSHLRVGRLGGPRFEAAPVQ